MSSPNIKIKETIFENPILATPGAKLVLIGTANWGKIEKVQITNTIDRYKLLYGSLKNRNNFSSFAVRKYLNYSSNLYYVRVADENNIAKAEVEIKDINLSGEPLIATITAKYDGTLGNEIVVEFDLQPITSGEPKKYIVNVYVENSLKETYKNVVFDKTSDNFIEKVINEVSGYIEIDVEDESFVNDDTFCFIENNRAEKTFNLTGGQDGDGDLNNDLIDSISRVIDKLKDKDKYVFDIVYIPDYNTSDVVVSKLQELVNARNDCMTFLDVPFGTGFLNDPIQNAVDYSNGNLPNTLRLDNKNVAIYAYWQKDLDNLDKVYKWLPPSIYAISVVANNANEFEIWYPPAGLDYGKINTTETTYSPSQPERDILYGEQLNGEINVINPIVDFDGDGIVIWGQRTSERSDKPTNRLNVELMLNYLKQKLYRIGKYIQFKFNTTKNQQIFYKKADNVLSYIQRKSGVKSYEIFCGEEVNTPDVVANNKFKAKIRLIPTSVAEDVEIELEVTPESVVVE